MSSNKSETRVWCFSSLSLFKILFSVTELYHEPNKPKNKSGLKNWFYLNLLSPHEYYGSYFQMSFRISLYACCTEGFVMEVRKAH